MLYLVKFSNAYGSDILLKTFETRAEATGFKGRFNRLMASKDSYVEEVDETDKCSQCREYIVDILRSGKLHTCEV